jgi:hypothetical protein
MSILFATFLIPIAILLARLVLILRPNLWAVTKAEVLDYGFKTRVYKGKYTAKFLCVRYSFIVNNKKYTSKRVSLDLFDKVYNDAEIEADELIERLKSNNVTTMYVKGFPSISVIQSSLYNGKDLLPLIIYLVTVMIAMFVIIIFLSRSK